MKSKQEKSLVTVRVKVKPGSSKPGVEAGPEGELTVRTRARAVEGKANAELIALLAEYFGVPQRDIVIIAGAHARMKRVVIGGVGCRYSGNDACK